MKWILILTLVFLGIARVSWSSPDLAELKKMSSRFAPVKLKVSTSRLSMGDKKALKKILEASRILDRLFLIQYWKGNLALKEKLAQDHSSLGKARMHYFNLNMGPWSAIDEQKVFIPGAPEKHPEGSNFYPEDMTKEEFEKWVSSLSHKEADQAKGFFSVIKRDSQGKLQSVPYSKEYGMDLERAADLLMRAANDTSNESLKKYLSLRAKALLTDDYYESDVAWMDMDSPIDLTFGPYETYNDGLFGYKAAFEAFVTIKDDKESAKLDFFSQKLQEIEDNLPMDEKFKNHKLGGMAPIRVVNQVIATGDSNHGVRTAAFNLPNDEKVIHDKGSKRVMLKNVQEAKFKETLVPISKKVLPASSLKYLSFDSFFTHILAHELSHGIGPHKITINGRESDPRQELKEVFGPLEEAKADITGLYMLQYHFDHGWNQKREKELYTTFLASAFRTLRFGLQEAHGKGMALQFNYLLNKGGFKFNPQDQTYEVDFTKIKDAVRSLTHDILTLEATGDYEGTKKFFAANVVLKPELQGVLEKLKSIPTDIEPISSY